MTLLLNTQAGNLSPNQAIKLARDIIAVCDGPAIYPPSPPLDHQVLSSGSPLTEQAAALKLPASLPPQKKSKNGKVRRVTSNVSCNQKQPEDRKPGDDPSNGGGSGWNGSGSHTSIRSKNNSNGNQRNKTGEKSKSNSSASARNSALDAAEAWTYVDWDNLANDYNDVGTTDSDWTGDWDLLDDKSIMGASESSEEPGIISSSLSELDVKSWVISLEDSEVPAQDPEVDIPAEERVKRLESMISILQSKKQGIALLIPKTSESNPNEIDDLESRVFDRPAITIPNDMEQKLRDSELHGSILHTSDETKGKV